MIEKEKFMKVLSELIELAKEKKNILEMEEIKSFFQGIELQKEQFDSIYEYLAANKITVREYFSANELKEEKQEKEESFYIEQLQTIETYSEQEEKELYEQLLQGDKNAKEKLLQSKLGLVVEIAKQYENMGVLLEDLIQEGNIGLIMAVDFLFHSDRRENCEEVISDYIKQSICFAIDEQTDRKEKEDKMIAKTGLIGEAAKYLAQDLGRVATLKELAAFTNLSEEEIEKVLKFSPNTIELGTGE